MGIHFVCHQCSHALHVKDFQAGKRGKCPNCKGSFRIPSSDSSYSEAIEDPTESSGVVSIREAFKKVNSPSATKLVKTQSDSDAISLELLTGPEVPRRRPDVHTTSKADAKASSKPSVASPTVPSVFAEGINAKWFVRPPSGGQFGPAESELLLTWIAESRVPADSFLWREGMAEWQTAKELMPESFEDVNQIITSDLAPLPSQKTDTEEGIAIETDSVLSELPSLLPGALLKKRMQKRRQQLRMVIVLATVSLILLGILIFVLVFRVNPTAPPRL